MKLVLTLLLLFSLTGIYGHSYISTPISRANQRQTESGCRGPACLGPCEVVLASALTPVAPTSRGANLMLSWPRNNHAGGFVRYSWAPTAKSDNMSVFDANAQLFTCFEIGTNCAPSDPTDPNGGDTGGQYNCGYNLTVPGYLTDGLWTFQWAWFGGAFSLGDYYSCVDYTVSGGPSSAQEGAYFIGGDYSNPHNKSVCKYFNTDKLHECINEPCNNVIDPGQNTGAPAGIKLGSPSLLGSSSSEGNAPIPCTNNTQCPTGVCEISGFCYNGKNHHLDAGGIAALFFAFLFVIIVISAIFFAYVNKSEWNNWKPFNKFSSKA